MHLKLIKPIRLKNNLRRSRSKKFPRLKMYKTWPMFQVKWRVRPPQPPRAKGRLPRKLTKAQAIRIAKLGYVPRSKAARAARKRSLRSLSSKVSSDG